MQTKRIMIFIKLCVIYLFSFLTDVFNFLFFLKHPDSWAKMQVAISVSLAFRNTCYSFHSQLVSLLMCRACLGFYNPCVSYPNHYRSLCTVDFVKDLPLYALRTEWKIHILKITDKAIPITWVPFTNFLNRVYTWFHRLIPWAVVIIPACDLIRWANLSFILSSLQD